MMQESAGNEYQGKSIGTDFSIQLLATQFTYEEDSFDENYDKDALLGDLVVADENSDLLAILASAKKDQPLTDYEAGMRSGYLQCQTDHAGLYKYKKAISEGKSKAEARAISQQKSSK